MARISRRKVSRRNSKRNSRISSRRNSRRNSRKNLKKKSKRNSRRTLKKQSKRNKKLRISNQKGGAQSAQSARDQRAADYANRTRTLNYQELRDEEVNAWEQYLMAHPGGWLPRYYAAGTGEVSAGNFPWNWVQIAASTHTEPVTPVVQAVIQMFQEVVQRQLAFLSADLGTKIQSINDAAAAAAAAGLVADTPQMRAYVVAGDALAEVLSDVERTVRSAEVSGEQAVVVGRYAAIMKLGEIHLRLMLRDETPRTQEEGQAAVVEAEEQRAAEVPDNYGPQLEMNLYYVYAMVILTYIVINNPMSISERGNVQSLFQNLFGNGLSTWGLPPTVQQDVGATSLTSLTLVTGLLKYLEITMILTNYAAGQSYGILKFSSPLVPDVGFQIDPWTSDVPELVPAPPSLASGRNLSEAWTTYVREVWARPSLEHQKMFASQWAAAAAAAAGRRAFDEAKLIGQLNGVNGVPGLLAPGRVTAVCEIMTFCLDNSGTQEFPQGSQFREIAKEMNLS